MTVVEVENMILGGYYSYIKLFVSTPFINSEIQGYSCQDKRVIHDECCAMPFDEFKEIALAIPFSVDDSYELTNCCKYRKHSWKNSSFKRIYSEETMNFLNIHDAIVFYICRILTIAICTENYRVTENATGTYDIECLKELRNMLVNSLRVPNSYCEINNFSNDHLLKVKKCLDGCCDGDAKCDWEILLISTIRLYKYISFNKPKYFIDFDKLMVKLSDEINDSLNDVAEFN